jgi:hypothetical protein
MTLNDMLGFTDFFDRWRLLGSTARIFVLCLKFRDDILQGFEQLRRSLRAWLFHIYGISVRTAASGSAQAIRWQEPV